MGPVGQAPDQVTDNTPWSNGKAERFIKTLLSEWASAMPFHTSGGAECWLSRYLGLPNGHRCPMALGGLSPQPSLQRLLNAE